MARVSLILPTTPEAPSPSGQIPALRVALERAGHEVEVILAVGPNDPEPDSMAWRVVHAPVVGQAAAAIAGLEEARGDFLLVLDATMGYAPSVLPRVVEALAEGGSELVVASRFAPGTGRIRATVGALVRPLVGSTDPLSGLIGLSRAGLDSAGQFNAVGAKFSFELIAKVAARGRSRRLDLPVRRGRPTHRTRLGWDDLRHVKRLADHRYGNLSRLVQFCVVGASGMVVDLSLYALFQWIFARTPMAGQTVPYSATPLPLAVAGVLSVSMALVWNFSLNRRLTFNYARAGSAYRQFLKYALSNAVSVPLSLFLRLWLPGTFRFFNDHRLAAAVVGIVAGTAVSFSMSRWVVFRHQPTHSPPHPGNPRPHTIAELPEPTAALGRDALLP